MSAPATAAATYRRRLRWVLGGLAVVSAAVTAVLVGAGGTAAGLLAVLALPVAGPLVVLRNWDPQLTGSVVSMATVAGRVGLDLDGLTHARAGWGEDGEPRGLVLTTADQSLHLGRGVRHARILHELRQRLADPGTSGCQVDPPAARLIRVPPTEPEGSPPRRGSADLASARLAGSLAAVAVGVPVGWLAALGLA